MDDSVDYGIAGGPAFPVTVTNEGDTGSRGMSLRDWFAGMAMQGFLASGIIDWRPTQWADSAYIVADAMLAARDRR